MNASNVVDNFFAASQGVQAVLSGNPDICGDSEPLVFILLLITGLIFALMLSLFVASAMETLTRLIRPSCDTSLSVAFFAFVLMLVLFSSAEWKIYSEHMSVPQSPHYVTLFKGGHYDSFRLDEPFDKHYLLPTRLEAINKVAVIEGSGDTNIIDNSYTVRSGEVIGMDKGRFLYRVYFKDDAGGIWRMPASLFAYIQRDKSPDLTSDLRNAQADFEKINH